MPSMTFTRKQRKVDPTTGRPVTTTVTIPGKGVVLSGDPKRFEVLQLRQGEAQAIKWAPLVYGQTPDPAPGDVTTFDGKTWTVRDVQAINPDAKALVFATIIVAGSG